REKNEDGERQELFDLGFSAAEELLGILNEFVNINKYDTGDFALNKKPFDLKEMVDSVIKLESLHIKQKALALRYHFDDTVPLEVVSDKYRLRGILMNVLSNAVKFTDTGFIEIEITAEQQSGKAGTLLHFRVK